MKILVAPERFYPAMKAQAVAQAMARGLERVSPHFNLIMYPLASGGMGTTDLAVRIAKGRMRQETILFNHHRRDVKWAMLPDGTAIFDAREALGAPDGPSPLKHTDSDTSSLGDMIMRLLSYEPKQIAIALGDVLAADGGLGLLQKFGVRIYGEEGDVLPSGARQLLRVNSVSFGQLEPPPVPILALTDGHASWNNRVQQEDFRLDLIYGGLMGASERFGNMLAEHVLVPLPDIDGTGAGGGLGLALAFMGAQFREGAAYLAELGGLFEEMWHVDWVMTGSSVLGEASMDQAVGTAARLARDAGTPAVALAIELTRGHARLYDEGLSGLYSVLDRPRPAKDVLRMLPALLEQAAYRTGMWMQAMSDPT